MTITVLLVDDHPVVRSGLRAVLEADDLSVVGEASTGEEAIVLAGHLHPTTRLSGLARDSVRLPCFAWAPGLLVLPAFGAFTGSAPDLLPAHAERFGVTDRAVHRLR